MAEVSTRYADTFASLKAKGEGAFVPFVMLGDPDIETSIDIIRCLIQNGADALELGFPFSDPVADGPTIQASGIRALAANTKMHDCFAMLKRVREEFTEIPIGLLLYANLVVHKGIDDFYAAAKHAGVDSVLIADVPVKESEPFIQAAKQQGIQPILIAPPNASEATLKAIAERSQGYTYLLSRRGITGAETQVEMPAEQLIKAIQSLDAAPTLLGFGVSTPEHVKNALAQGVDGVIVGSAIVKLIEENLADKAQLLDKLGYYIRELKAATKAS